MGVSKTTYEKILKEYDELQLKEAAALRMRKEKIYSEIPRVQEIESEITSLQINRILSRINSQTAANVTEKIAELKKEKSDLLSASGYSLKDLEPAYECPKCHDTGYLEDGSECSCFIRKKLDYLYDMSHIRVMLEKENFSAFRLDYYSDEKPAGKTGKTEKGAARDAFEKATAFVRDFDNSADNLYICGDTGVGKTFLSNCIAKEILDSGHSVVYLSAVRLFDILADEAFNRNDDSDISADYIYDCDLLIIDDLGTELTNSFVQTGLFKCINERYIRNRHTIISTNLSVEQLQVIYSERVFSRIMSNYKIIKLFGDDIRIKKILED